MRRLSIHSDALCHACDRPAAEGLSDGEGLWCRDHGRLRVVMHLERAAFMMLQTYGRTELETTIAAVLAHRSGPDIGSAYAGDLRSDELATSLPTRERVR